MAGPIAVDTPGMDLPTSNQELLSDLLNDAVALGVLSVREAAQLRGRVRVDAQGHWFLPEDMDRQLGKLFMMSVVPANTLPL